MLDAEYDHPTHAADIVSDQRRQPIFLTFDNAIRRPLRLIITTLDLR